MFNLSVPVVSHFHDFSQSRESLHNLMDLFGKLGIGLWIDKREVEKS